MWYNIGRLTNIIQNKSTHYHLRMAKKVESKVLTRELHSSSFRRTKLTLLGLNINIVEHLVKSLNFFACSDRTALKSFRRSNTQIISRQIRLKLFQQHQCERNFVFFFKIFEWNLFPFDVLSRKLTIYQGLRACLCRLRECLEFN